MNAGHYAYSAEPTRNPFRYALAVWRLIRNDPSQSTDAAAIVEIGFARSKRGRRFARWESTIEELKSHPKFEEALRTRRSFGPIDLERLAKLPPQTLGRALADQCRAKQIDPNLVYVPPDDEVGWFLNHLYQTHDIWHVLTGWGNDLPGEVGLGGFYCAQLRTPTFFGYMFSLVMLNVILRRANLDEVIAAIGAGYRAGQRAELLFGVDWSEHWAVPLAELRARLSLEQAEIIGEGVAA